MIIVVFEDEMGDADGGIDIPCKIIKKESIIVTAALRSQRYVVKA